MDSPRSSRGPRIDVRYIDDVLLWGVFADDTTQFHDRLRPQADPVYRIECEYGDMAIRSLRSSAEAWCEEHLDMCEVLSGRSRAASIEELSIQMIPIRGGGSDTWLDTELDTDRGTGVNSESD